MRFKTVDEPKNQRFYVRLTETEKNIVRDKSEQCGKRMSDYVRDLAIGKRVVPKTDMKMLNELRRQGGSIRNLLNSSEGAKNPEIAKALIATLNNILDTIKTAFV